MSENKRFTDKLLVYNISSVNILEHAKDKYIRAQNALRHTFEIKSWACIVIMEG